MESNRILNKKTLIILVILVIIAGFSGWFIFSYQKLENKKDTDFNQVNQESNKQSGSLPKEEQNSATTPALKIYSNKQFGFEFRYPADWEIRENVFGSPASKFNLNIVPNTERYLPDPVLINIVTPSFGDRAFQDLENIASKITVGGISGKRYDYKFEGMQRISILLSFGELRIILGSEQRYEAVFNQILSTFKFLDKVQTYRNEQHGFEYQYPSNLTFQERNLPTYIFTDSGEVCKNLLQEESRPRRLLNETILADPSTKFKVEVVTISVYENSGNLSLDGWLNSGTKFLAKHSEECKYDDKNYIEIRLNNEKSVTIDNTPGVEGFSGCCMVSNKNIYLTKNGKVYNLSFSGDVNDSPIGKCANNLEPFSDNKYSCPYIDEDIYNQILASFKFLK